MDRNVAPLPVDAILNGYRNGYRVVDRAPLELWHLPDGRVLLHQHGRGAQAWVEVQPEALLWLIEQLQNFKEVRSHGQGDT